MNLTQELNVVSSSRQGYSPLPGHTIVVFEVVEGGGMKLESVVPDGGEFKPRKRVFGKPIEYVSYPVDTNPDRRHQFSARVPHMTPGHSFDLTFTVKFCAAEARTLAQRVVANGDPVKSLQEEIERCLGHAVASKTWIEIENSKQRDNFARLGQQVYDGHSKELTEFAARHGIKLHGVRIEFAFTAEDEKPLAAATGTFRTLQLTKAEEDIAAEKRKRETAQESARIADETILAEKQHALDALRRRNQNQIAILNAGLTVVEASGVALGTAVRNLGENTDDADTFERNVGVYRRVLEPLMLPPSAQGAHHAEVQDVSSSLPLLPTPAARTELEKLHIEIMQTLGPLAAKRGRSRRFFVACLQWVAEISLGDEANAELLAQCKKRLDDEPGMTPSQTLLVRQLLDEAELKARLS